MKLPRWFMEERAFGARGAEGMESPGFVEKNLRSVASFMKEVFEPEEFASKGGLLQGLDPRARILGIFFLLLCAAAADSLLVPCAVIFVTALLAYRSNITLRAVAKRVLPSFVFTLILVLPVTINLVSPGPELIGFYVAGHRAALTWPGLYTGLLLLTRVSSMVALLSLLLLSTTQPELFRGLRGLPVPGFFVTALFMTFRYIFILLRLVEDSSLAMKSRTISRRAVRESRRWFASRVALLIERSLKVAEDVSMAMASRGFTGEMRTIEEYSMKGRDFLYLGAASFFFFLSLGL